MCGDGIMREYHVECANWSHTCYAESPQWAIRYAIQAHHSFHGSHIVVTPGTYWHADVYYGSDRAASFMLRIRMRGAE